MVVKTGHLIITKTEQEDQADSLDLKFIGHLQCSRTVHILQRALSGTIRGWRARASSQGSCSIMRRHSTRWNSWIQRNQISFRVL